VGVHPASASRKAGQRGRLNVPGRSFPKGFLWGTSSAAHQVEGDNRNSDWWEWEQVPGRVANGDTTAVACDHNHRNSEDFWLLGVL
jgi:beta-glucosidase